MKEIKAWETSDGKVFFKKGEAESHENGLRHDSVREKLTALFARYDDPDAAAAIALHVVQNAREFAMAISPLITKSSPRKQPFVDHEMRDYDFEPAIKDS